MGAEITYQTVTLPQNVTSEQPEALLPLRIRLVDDLHEPLADAVTLRDRRILSQGERRQIADADDPGGVGADAVSAKALRYVRLGGNRLHRSASRQAERREQQREQDHPRPGRVRRSGWHGRPFLG